MSSPPRRMWAPFSLRSAGNFLLLRCGPRRHAPRPPCDRPTCHDPPPRDGRAHSFLRGDRRLLLPVRPPLRYRLECREPHVGVLVRSHPCHGAGVSHSGPRNRSLHWRHCRRGGHGRVRHDADPACAGLFDPALGDRRWHAGGRPQRRPDRVLETSAFHRDAGDARRLSRLHLRDLRPSACSRPDHDPDHRPLDRGPRELFRHWGPAWAYQICTDRRGSRSPSSSCWPCSRSSRSCC